MLISKIQLPYLTNQIVNPSWVTPEFEQQLANPEAEYSEIRFSIAYSQKRVEFYQLKDKTFLIPDLSRQLVVLYDRHETKAFSLGRETVVLNSRNYLARTKKLWAITLFSLLGAHFT